MENHSNNLEAKAEGAGLLSQGNGLSVPAAIVIAGAFIAVAVFFGMRGGDLTGGRIFQPQEEERQTGDLKQMDPVMPADHVRGNLNAPVKIVEYSDFECPFCKVFHGTMNRIMAEYGSNGGVAWVYRHFPLDQLHPVKARKEAVAAECANELGGNDAFWKFADRFFELTLSNNQTNIEVVLPQVAREIGLNEAAFGACLKSSKHDARIEANAQNAMETGGNGTPWSIVVGKNGKPYPLSGAQPYEAVKELIGRALQGK